MRDALVDIRPGTPADLPGLERLYPAAFPHEDLLPLVRELLQDRPDVLSLVAVLDGALAGHVAFTRCGVTANDGTAALLGPLGVVPDRQRHGLGSTLVRDGLRRLEQAAVRHVYVLGDPAYYARFGFTPETRVAPPYPLPMEWTGAWQSVALHPAAPTGPGRLVVPAPWQRPALWAG